MGAMVSEAGPAAPPAQAPRTSSHQAGDWQTPDEEAEFRAQMRDSSIGALERQLNCEAEAAVAASDLAATKFREAAEASRAALAAMLQADKLHAHVLELRKQLQKARHAAARDSTDTGMRPDAAAQPKVILVRTSRCPAATGDAAATDHAAATGRG